MNTYFRFQVTQRWLLAFLLAATVLASSAVFTYRVGRVTQVADHAEPVAGPIIEPGSKGKQAS